MTPRPSSSGTSSPGRRREVSTVRAPPTGLSLSKWAWEPRWPLYPLLHRPAWHFFVFLRWSHDGKFFARMTLDTLSIYETPVSGLFDYLT